MTTPLFTALAANATARAHLVGAESNIQNDMAYETDDADVTIFRMNTAIALRCQYWRELSAAAALLGSPWREAERMGGR